MAKKTVTKRRARSEEVEREHYSDALKQDLLEYARRAKPVIARENQQRMRLLKMLGIDPKEAAQAREQDYKASIGSARERLKRLNAAQYSAARKKPTLMAQIKMLSGSRGR